MHHLAATVKNLSWTSAGRVAQSSAVLGESASQSPTPLARLMLCVVLGSRPA